MDRTEFLGQLPEFFDNHPEYKQSVEIEFFEMGTVIPQTFNATFLTQSQVLKKLQILHLLFFPRKFYIGGLIGVVADGSSPHVSEEGTHHAEWKHESSRRTPIETLETRALLSASFLNSPLLACAFPPPRR